MIEADTPLNGGIHLPLRKGSDRKKRRYPKCYPSYPRLQSRLIYGRFRRASPWSFVPGGVLEYLEGWVKFPWVGRLEKFQNPLSSLSLRPVKWARLITTC